MNDASSEASTVGGSIADRRFLLFVVTPEHDSNGQVCTTARGVLMECARRGFWPVGKHAQKARRFKPGDRILFYAAGKGDPDQSSFIAVGTVTGVLVENQTRLDSATESAKRAWVSTAFELPISDIRVFERAVPVRPLIPKMAFFPNKEQWSAKLAGAIHRIEQADFQQVLSAAASDTIA